MHSPFQIQPIAFFLAGLLSEITKLSAVNELP